MPIFDEVCLGVLEATEFVTIVTNGPDGPHLAATWGDYVRQLGVEDGRLLIPAGYYRHTEANLKLDDRIQLMVASRQVEGSRSPGQGCVLTGRGTILTSGEEMDRAQALFPWARGVLVVQVEKASRQL
jgi:hypothetical protein